MNLVQASADSKDLLLNVRRLVATVATVCLLVSLVNRSRITLLRLPRCFSRERISELVTMQRLMAADRLHPCAAGADRPVEHGGDDAAGQFWDL